MRERESETKTERQTQRERERVLDWKLSSNNVYMKKTPKKTAKCAYLIKCPYMCQKMNQWHKLLRTFKMNFIFKYMRIILHFIFCFKAKEVKQKEREQKWSRPLNSAGAMGCVREMEKDFHPSKAHSHIGQCLSNVLDKHTDTHT